MVLCAAGPALGAVERFPPPEFESGYELPTMPIPWPRVPWQEVADVAVLAGALSVAAWLVLRVRNRRAVQALSIAALAYFGFDRGGCVCPIGAIQHVARALADPTYAVPLTWALFFALPLVFALLFGRVFCGGVCPLGAIQDLVLVRPVRVPRWLDRALGLVPFAYLGAAVLFATASTDHDTLFIICRYDPFVSLFRLDGPFDMLVLGGGFVLLSAFVGRPYCRFLCPYGALLSLCSRWAWRRPSTTPDECIVCSLCEQACPFGAIQAPTPEGVEAT